MWWFGLAVFLLSTAAILISVFRIQSILKDPYVAKLAVMVVVAAQERMSTRNIVLVYIPAPPPLAKTVIRSLGRST